MELKFLKVNCWVKPAYLTGGYYQLGRRRITVTKSRHFETVDQVRDFLANLSRAGQDAAMRGILIMPRSIELDTSTAAFDEVSSKPDKGRSDIW